MIEFSVFFSESSWSSEAVDQIGGLQLVELTGGRVDRDAGRPQRDQAGAGDEGVGVVERGRGDGAGVGDLLLEVGQLLAGGRVTVELLLRGVGRVVEDLLLLHDVAGRGDVAGVHGAVGGDLLAGGAGTGGGRPGLREVAEGLGVAVGQRGERGGEGRLVGLGGLEPVEVGVGGEATGQRRIVGGLGDGGVQAGQGARGARGGIDELLDGLGGLGLDAVDRPALGVELVEPVGHRRDGLLQVVGVLARVDAGDRWRCRCPWPRRWPCAGWPARRSSSCRRSDM